jgi:hypothetical protein
MKGDYYRYISEYATGDQHKRASDGANAAYQAASDVANNELKTTNPIRLGLALNYSVFYYEVLNDPAKACNLAKQVRHRHKRRPSMMPLPTSSTSKKTSTRTPPPSCN